MYSPKTKQIASLQCIFSKVVDGKRVDIVIYVDDLFFFYDDEELMENDLDLLQNKYKMKFNYGNKQNYLGMEFNFENETNISRANDKISSDISISP